MTETNALAEGVASTSSEQTVNAPSSPEQTLTTQTAPETEAAEQSEDTQDQAAEAAPEGEQPKSDAPKQRTANDRISQLKRERDEAEIRAYAAEQKLKALNRPVRAKEGMTDIQRAAVDMRNADRELEREEVASTVDEARHEMRQARLAMFTEKVGDQAVVEAFCRLPRVSEELADLVSDSDKAKEIAARLSGNPAEARRLSSLAPHRLGAEIARMEREFEKAPPVRRVSQAPEPGSSLKGGSNPVRKTPDKMSYSEYRDMREKQEAAARR